MIHASAVSIALLLVEPSPAPEPAGPDLELVDAMLDDVDPKARSARRLEQAVVHAEEQRYDEAAHLGLEAYRILPEDMRYSDSGLFAIVAAVDYHDKAYRQSEDELLLARIQGPLEDFLERYQGLDPRIDRLQRKLELFRKLRLAVAERHYREKEFLAAAVEARDCYRALRTNDKGRAIGEQAAIAASQAYRQAWYVDGDIRHIDAAIELVDDHLGHAGDGASPKVKRERAKLESFGIMARASGGGIVDEGDPGGIAPRDRSFLFAASAAVGGGVVLSTGAAAVGAYAFDFEYTPTNEIRAIRGEPAAIATAVPLGLVAGVVTGLAIHAMVDGGFIPPRGRKLLAVSATAVGLLGMVVGSSLLAVGATRQDDLSALRARGFENAGFSLMVGMGAPLGAGIAALVSRRAGAR